MENPEIKACPFCGSEAKLTEGPHGKRIYCRHDSTCLIRGQIVYDFNLTEWNRRAGDRQPAPPETGGVKALASATGSAAAEIVKALKNPRVLRWTTWDVFAGRQINHERGLSQEEAVIEVLKRHWPNVQAERPAKNP